MLFYQHSIGKMRGIPCWKSLEKLALAARGSALKLFFASSPIPISCVKVLKSLIVVATNLADFPNSTLPITTVPNPAIAIIIDYLHSYSANPITAARVSFHPWWESCTRRKSRRLVVFFYFFSFSGLSATPP
jgi:hypothetical protein